MAIAVSQAYKDAIRGPIDRSKLKVEVYFSGALGWVDISDWVEQASGEKEEGSDKGTASTNTVILTLINDDGRFCAKNSAGPYYGNLTPNKPIRASIVVGSEPCRLGTVYSGAWPTQAKSRTCQVQAQDAARLLLRKDISEETVFNPSNLAAGYYLTRVLERAAWLSGLRWDAATTRTDLNGHAWAFTSHDGNAIAVTKNAGAAVATYTLGGQLVMQLDLVDLLIPVAPLKGKALAVLDQLAKVVDGRIYFEAQGQLVFRSRMYRNDSTVPSVETFTVDNLDDVITDQGFEGTRFAPLINRAEVTSTPYAFRLDADGQVLEEEIPFKGDLFAKYHFAPGESYPASGDADLWCELPNGVQIAKAGNYPAADNVILESAPKSDLTKRGTGIRFKAGFPVFEQGRMKVAFENAGTEAEVIKTLTLKARMMRPVQRCRGVTKNQASIDLYDQRDRTYNNDLIPHATACKNLSAWQVEDGREPKLVVTLKGMHGVPWLEINDRITVSETLTKSIPVAEDFIVKRIKWIVTLVAFTATIDACSPSPNFTASALPPTVAVVETSNQNMNGAEQAALPPQVIDGTQSLVGLNNTPTLEWVTRRAQAKTYGANVVSARYCLYDGSVVHLAAGISGGQRLHKISSMSGDIQSTDTLFNSAFGKMSLARDGAIVVPFLSGWLERYINGLVQTKSSISIALGISGQFNEVICAGGKIYAWVTIPSGDEIWIWDSDDGTRQDLPDSREPDTGAAPGGEKFSWDGAFLYITQNYGGPYLIQRYDSQSGLYDSPLTLPAGDIAYTHLFDGRSFWVGLEDGSGNGIVAQYQMHPYFWSASRRTLAILTDEPVKRMLFDGMYIWGLSTRHLYQISTSGSVVAKYELTVLPGAPTGLTFDGTAIWATLNTGTVYRVPRIVSGRQF